MAKYDKNYEESKLELSKRKLGAKLRLANIIEEEFKKYETSFYSLTNRQKEILQYMALGYDSKKIAIELNISKHTVDTHRKNIYKKTELKTLRDVVLLTLIFDMTI